MRQTLTDHQPRHAGGQPLGTLQDAGELAVASDRSGNTRHRYAMVVSFSTEDELRRAIEAHQCAYRDSQTIQEALHG